MSIYNMNSTHIFEGLVALLITLLMVYTLFLGFDPEFETRNTFYKLWEKSKVIFIVSLFVLSLFSFIFHMGNGIKIAIVLILLADQINVRWVKHWKK